MFFRCLLWCTSGVPACLSSLPEVVLPALGMSARLISGISVHFKAYIKAEHPWFVAESWGELSNLNSKQKMFTLPLTTTASTRWLSHIYWKLSFIDLLAECHTDSPSKFWEINIWTYCLHFGYFLTTTQTPTDWDYFALQTRAWGWESIKLPQ